MNIATATSIITIMNIALARAMITIMTITTVTIASAAAIATRQRWMNWWR